MKIENTESLIINSGAVESKAYGIQLNAFAFKQLSTGIYEDGVKAVIRELSTNAYDSHVEAGNPEEPFEVKLPSKLDPTFYVRDYGVGMSHEMCMNTYSELFASTKRNTNDAVGCIGLGCKTPFTISHTFNLECHENGETRFYAIAPGPDELPVFNYIGKKFTGERNGVKVYMTVPADKIEDFEHKAREVFVRFKTIPKITGIYDFEVEPVNYTVEGKCWGFRENHTHESAVAVMGNIGYPINVLSMNRSSMTDQMRAVLRRNIDIQFEIGELDITTSREALDYDSKKTNASIIAKVARVCRELNANLSKQLDNCASLYDAKCLAGELLEYGGSLFELRQLIDTNNVEYKGTKIKSSRVKLDFADCHIRQFEYAAGNRYNYSTGAYDKKVRQNNQDTWFAKKSTIIVIDDMKRGAFSRVKYNMEEKLISAEHVVLIRLESDTAKTEFKKQLGVAHTNFVHASSLDEVPKTVKGSTVRQNRTVCKFNANTSRYGSTMAQHWEPRPNVDFAQDSGYYVQMKRDRYIDVNGYDSHPKSLAKVVNHIKTLGKSIEVIGIKKSQMKHIKDNTNWQTIFEYGKKLAEAKSKDAALMLNCAKYKAYQRYYDREDMMLFQDKVKSINKGLFRTLVESTIEYGNALDSSTEDVAHSLEYFGFKLTDVTVPSLNDIQSKIWKQYPALNLVQDTNYRGEFNGNIRISESRVNTIIDYVNTIDKP
jgi:hypothetical protein